MGPESHSQKSSNQPEFTSPAGSAVNGDNGEHRFWPFEGEPPRRLTPEEIQELLKLWTEEDEKEAAVGLQECLEGRGVSSEELFRTLEKVIRDNG